MGTVPVSHILILRSGDIACKRNASTFWRWCRGTPGTTTRLRDWSVLERGPRVSNVLSESCHCRETNRRKKLTRVTRRSLSTLRPSSSSRVHRENNRTSISSVAVTSSKRRTRMDPAWSWIILENILSPCIFDSICGDATQICIVCKSHRGAPIDV
jgi:hypothetical protein